MKKTWNFVYAGASVKVHQNDNVGVVKSLYSIYRGKGEANALMRMITEFADKNGITLILEAQPFGHPEQTALNRVQLENFYRNHGFKTFPGNQIPRTMTRLPQQKHD